MPELPEVETTRRGIAAHVEGRQIKALTVREPRLRWPIEKSLPRQVRGVRITTVDRRGKYLKLCSAKGYLLIHLGMSGSLRIVKAGEPPAKHDHFDIAFDDGAVLRYCDPRRFGSLHWQVGDQDHPLLASLGPEPLHDEFNLAYLCARAAGKKQAVKTFLMDSQMVVGVGNIYANEALYRAGIHPRRAAGRVSKARYERLLAAVKAVLSEAIAEGGTTLRDFVGGDGKPGYFRMRLDVYGRGGETCHGCPATLKEIRLGQRTTVFCPRCQR